MGSQEKFDVTVVGAGPAGLSAAYFLASKGFSVVVLEKGAEVGAKNVFGGRIYSYFLDKHFQGWRNEAPVERWIRRERFGIFCREGSVTLDYRRDDDTGGSFTAFLGRFLQWFSSKVEEAGGLVATGVRVDGVEFRDGYASGVMAAGELIESDYVVIAEGANHILLEKHGLGGKPDVHEMALGIKEVIKLDSRRIEERFNVGEGEGVAHLFIGRPIEGLLGGGFLYTMKEHVAIGLVIRLSDLQKGMTYAKEVAEDLRLLPAINGLVGDGVPVEYSAHLVWEGNYESAMRKPFGNGFLVVGDAAGLLLNTGFTIRGVDIAMESGRLAAEAIAKARDAGSREEADLSYYWSQVKDGPIGRNLVRFSKLPSFMSNRRIYDAYPELLCSVLGKAYGAQEELDRLCSSATAAMGKLGISKFTVLLDALRGCGSL